jgi:hypothetical protein
MLQLAADYYRKADTSRGVRDSAKSLSCIDYPLPLFVPTELRRPRWSMRLVDDKDGFTLHCPIAQRRECSQRIAPAGF